MKLFNTLQELLDHSKFCPVCQESCRTITLELGPQPYTLNSYQIDNNLKLDCISKLGRLKYPIIFDIDPNLNLVKTSIFTPQFIEENETFVDRASKPYTFIKVMSDCFKCSCSNNTSNDIEIDILNKTLLSIYMDRESIYLLEKEDKFHITIIYDRKVVLVSKCSIESDGTVLDDNKVLELPFINLDFADQDKVINKIKTLILFS